MNNYLDLHESTILLDQARYTAFTNLICTIFNVKQLEIGKMYRYSTQLETPESRQYIIDNLKIFSCIDPIKSIILRNKRLVYWTINHFVDVLNEKYHFTQPMTFSYRRINERNNDKVVTLTYYDFRI